MIDETMNEARFILWDPKDGEPYRNQDTGEITSSGILGEINLGNVYLMTYASYPGNVRPKDLAVNERIQRVKFSLSRRVGYYDVWRVR